MAKLVIPKNTADLEEVKGALQIYYDLEDWVDNEKYIEEYIHRFGILNDGSDKSAYTKKGEIGAYYGFIEWKDISNKRSCRKITDSGRRFLQYWNNNDVLAMQEELILAIEHNPFGRHNFGCCSSDSDVDPPNVFLRAAYELNGISKIEFAYLVHRMNYSSYTDTINEIRSNRNSKQEIQLPSEASKYKDAKPILTLERWGILKNTDDRLTITHEFLKRFEKRIKTLCLYNIDKKCDDSLDSVNNDVINLAPSAIFDLSRQRIFFGAPGTGKSYSLNQEADDLVNHHTEQIERVTFHPDYTYANFVGTYKPIMKSKGSEEKITYEYVPGPFMRTLVNALKNPSVPYVLIVEEINRANVAAVFGDVFQLLDRDDYGNSQYNIAASEDIRNYLNKELRQEYNEISIPSNMFIWATMNSADQGVYPMDTAFKRRWDFTYFGINDGEEDLSENAVDKKFTLGSNMYACTVSWNDLRKAINNELLGIQYNINEDKLMGPFFMSNSALVTEDKFKEVFKNKVLMYLFEDVVKQKRRVFFEKCSSEGKGISYSDICHEFDQKGIEIFPDSIVEELKSVSTDSSNNMGTEG